MTRDTFADLLAANSAYAAAFEPEAESGRARRGLAVLTCVDSRIEPLGMLGLRPGDAMIVRNAGARASDDAIRSLALGTLLLGVDRIAVVQHTDCRVATSTQHEIVERFREAGVDAAGHDFLAIADQRATLEGDVLRLRSSELLGRRVSVAGFLFDVHTGRLEQVVPGGRT